MHEIVDNWYTGFSRGKISGMIDVSRKTKIQSLCYASSFGYMVIISPLGIHWTCMSKRIGFCAPATKTYNLYDLFELLEK
jgi:hypothetical protein